MRAKSKRRSGAFRPAAGKPARRSSRRRDQLDRPFDPAILRRAKSIARTYRLTFEPDADVGFVGASVEMPFVMADGPTIEACAAATLEALTAAIATLLEKGERPPSAASAGRREVQVNIRLTQDEKMRIEGAARRHGFRSVSDFIRTTAVQQSD